jgi:hypothetical protein
MLAKSKASQSASAAKSLKFGQKPTQSSKMGFGVSGAGGGFGMNAPGFGPKVTHFAGGGGGGKKIVDVAPEVGNAWDTMLDDNDPTTWVLAEYSSNGKKVELKTKGEGGLKTFIGALTPGIVAWGGFRCYGVDKRGSVVCKRPKFVFVQFKPEDASAMKKAKMAPHKGTVKEMMQGAHMDVTVEVVAEDLEEQSLITRLQAATGAHKPNGYEFEEDVFISADFYELGIGSDCAGGNAAVGK